ncbi:MAG: ABC transporter ATP-binding protein [Bacteroidales bacterium]|jgi:ABC-2 type transport system ATP-binding protein
MHDNFAIEISDLTKTYKGKKHPTLNELNLNIPFGSLFGLLAPNGAGKTTTISAICGLRKFEKGSIYINGLSVKKNLSQIKSIIGLVPQDIALFPTLTAMENLRIIGGIYGIAAPVLKKRIDDLLELFDLYGSRNNIISHYSGGMKRRINLIAGMLHEPGILILDEPTVGVDAQSRKLILEKLKEINRTGTTILFISHYLEEAEEICDQVAFIDNGRVISQGSPKELIERNCKCNNLESVYLCLTGKQMRDCNG